MALKPRVLLVEDEDIISMLTEEMLDDLGYDVVGCAATLEEGLKMAKNDQLDLAVLDINLRGTASFPIADVLAERSIPFLFASGYGASALEPRFLSATCLKKPFSSDDLQSKINNVLKNQ